jgi:hypothetical protein
MTLAIFKKDWHFQSTLASWFHTDSSL